MNTGNRVALAARQRALAAGIERIEADAKREGRDLTMEEIAQSDALAAALATLTRQINSSNDVTASAARVDVHRGHALARGPPSGHELIWKMAHGLHTLRIIAPNSLALSQTRKISETDLVDAARTLSAG